MTCWWDACAGYPGIFEEECYCVVCELTLFRTARVVDSDRSQLIVRKVSIFGVWRDDLSLLGISFMRIGG